MNSFIQHSVAMMVPLIISNSLHMVVVKKQWFKELDIPVSTKLFGKNKTWRGFAFLTICNGFLLYLLNIIWGFEIENSFALGAIFGFAYLLFELPNSYMKRKLGVAPGGQHLRYKYLFWWIDKSDSVIGLSFVYHLLGYISAKEALLLYIISSLTHMLTSKLLVLLKIKKSF